MYRYIGNKAKLTPYILDKVHQMIGDAGTVADIMAGTGTVSLELRKNLLMIKNVHLVIIVLWD